MLTFIEPSKEVSSLRLVCALEPLSRILQVAANVFAVLNNLVYSGAPILKQLLETLAAYTLPITLEIANMTLDLRADLIGNLIVELDEYLSQLAHQIGIYMNGGHKILLLFYVQSSSVEHRSMEPGKIRLWFRILAS
jgi:hypothetical protein